MENAEPEDYFDAVTKACRAEIERIVTQERVVADLHSYLELDKDENVTIKVVDDANVVRDIVIDRKDAITILARKIVFHDPRFVHFPLTVRIGIGRFEVVPGGWLVEKCVASLYYNHDIEMITADFDYNSIDIL